MVSLYRSVMAVKTLRVRQAEATRQLLIDVARRRFTEQGFRATSVEDIVSDAGVARGSLYHHFASKEELFGAVYDEVLSELVAEVVGAASAAADPWDRVAAGLDAFLDACLQPTFRRIVVLDSIAVLPHDVWEDGIEQEQMPMLRAVVEPLVVAVFGERITVDPLVHVVLGGLYGAALHIARSPDPAAARRETTAVLELLTDGLRSIAPSD